MKYTGILLPVYLLLLPAFLFAQTGSTCSAPYVIPLDNQCHDYTISATTGTTIHCTGVIPGYSGTGRLTIFSFTTNATASCVLINLTTSGGQPAEVLFYEGCGGGSLHENDRDDYSSVCFNDGTGLWAPSETFTLASNTTYYLRVWTPGSGTITMCAKSYDPPNNNCTGATPIGSTPVTDNNACHKPAQGIAPELLCAYSLENTAFYSYTTELTGASVITVSSILCDNSALSGSSGVQIGFFAGSCASLTHIGCYYDVGPTVQATINYLPGGAPIPAGTNIIVAVEGMGVGSNCTYTISATNAFSLPATLKYFSGWIKPDANVLRWLTLSEDPDTHFEIQKSSDGMSYFKIGMLDGKNHANSETDYSFEDKSILANQFYRLKIISGRNRGLYSNTIQLKRENANNESVAFQKVATSKVVVKTATSVEKNAIVQIIDPLGRQMKVQHMKIDRGENSYTIDIQSLDKGIYYLIFQANNTKKQFSFIKE
ncbi:MAG TPA: T9SS type A sorting domain-containing protein [Chitinophagaceae bacterium]|jgi:hypothetical protein|nr:T9SS type A sorting domain-containing protein [Chitinophagaceae bacterium]